MEILVVLLWRIGLQLTTLQRRAGLVSLVNVAASDWPNLPSFPFASGRHRPPKS